MRWAFSNSATATLFMVSNAFWRPLSDFAASYAERYPTAAVAALMAASSAARVSGTVGGAQELARRAKVIRVRCRVRRSIFESYHRESMTFCT